MLRYDQEPIPGRYLWGTEVWDDTLEMSKCLRYDPEEGGIVIDPGYYLDVLKIFGYVMSNGRATDSDNTHQYTDPTMFYNDVNYRSFRNNGGGSTYPSV